MRRREVIAGLGSTALWPLAAHGQGNMPVVGYLSSFSPEINRKFTEAFRAGLDEAGFREGRNVNIEYRWAEEGRYETLPKLAAELTDRRVSVIFASPIPAAIAAKAATATIPIVFAVGSDPVETGLVASLNRPGGNATGATFLSVESGSKRLELLRDLVPKVASVGLLVNPHNPNAVPQTKGMEEATKVLGLQLDTLEASAESDFDKVFRTAATTERRARGQCRSVFLWPSQPARWVGGRVCGISHYVLCARICFGRRPHQLCVQHRRLLSSSRYLRSAHPEGRESGRSAGFPADQVRTGDQPEGRKRVGLTVSPTLLARADEVIE